MSDAVGSTRRDTHAPDVTGPHPFVVTTGDLGERLRSAVRDLMDVAFGGDFADEDWEHTLGGWHAIVVDGGIPVAHAAVVPRTIEVGGRSWRTGYVEGVATAPDREGEGLGSAVMTTLGEVLRREFEFGALGTGRYAFYERLGWERWRGPTVVRDGGEHRRTPEDDDAVMVLRFGPSRDVDLTATIACHARPGDDW